MTLLSVPGTNTSNFTSTNALFLAYPQIHLWRFEVVYSFQAARSSISALHFLINQPPSNGSCSIGPSNGTTTTQFDISCPNWFDQDEIKDYSLYRTSRSAERTMIAFSSVSTFQVQLPGGNEPTFSLALVIYIRDTRDCITEWNLTSIVVRPDFTALDALINQFEDPFTLQLAHGNQNRIGQVISSLSQQLNEMNTRNIDNAVSNGVSRENISISPLGTQRSSSLVICSVLSRKNQINLFL
jgi:hypothetical protein